MYVEVALEMTPRNTPSNAAYPRISAGTGARLNAWTRDRTNAIRAAPTAMPYDRPMFASSTGSRSQDSTAVSTTVPSVVAVRTTTSSIVIAVPAVRVPASGPAPAGGA